MAKKKDPKEEGGANEHLHKKDIEEPAEGKINKYGFIGVSKKVLEAAGLEKGTEYPVEFTVEDRRLVVRMKKSA